MNKQALLEQVYNSAFQDALCKSASYYHGHTIDNINKIINTGLKAGSYVGKRLHVAKSYAAQYGDDGASSSIAKINIPKNLRKQYLQTDPANVAGLKFFGSLPKHMSGAYILKKDIPKDWIEKSFKPTKKSIVDAKNKMMNDSIVYAKKLNIDHLMDKQSYLSELYDSSFNDELYKMSSIYDKLESIVSEPVKNIFSKDDEFKENRINAIKSIYPLKIATGLLSIAPTISSIKTVLGSRKNNYSDIDSNKMELKLKKSMNIPDDIKIVRNSTDALRGGGGLFDPVTRTIHFASSPKSTEYQRAILSHELGHSKNITPKTKGVILGLRRVGKAGSGIGILGAAISKDSDNSKAFAIAGSALGSSILAEELLATTRGIRGLQKYHGGGISGLKNALLKGGAGGSRMALGNLLSYGLLATSPLIAYKLKEHYKNDK